MDVLLIIEEGAEVSLPVMERIKALEEVGFVHGEVFRRLKLFNFEPFDYAKEKGGGE